VRLIHKYVLLNDAEICDGVQIREFVRLLQDACQSSFTGLVCAVAGEQAGESQGTLLLWLRVYQNGRGAREVRMYRKVLVAVDFYSGGEKVLQRAVTLAKEWGAEVHLLHMVDEIFAPYGIMGAPMPVIDQKEIEEGSREQMTELAAKHGLTAENVHVESGQAVRGILATARDLDVDLIMLGSHGRHGIRLLLGSTANGVLHEADRDVLAIRITD
jgi:universal stress protein A